MAVGLSVLVASCASSSVRERVVVSRPSPQGGLASLPTGSPASGTWIAGQLPDGYVFVWAGDNPGPNGIRDHASSYGKDPTRDTSDAPLQVDSIAESVPLPEGRPVTVRSHRAVLSTLTDEGRPYGVRLTWQERKGLTISVSALEGVSMPEARLVAAHVRPVSPDTWRRLVIAADYIGRASPDMARVPITSGHIGDHRWTLTALLPPHYPVLAVDRRFACYELAYRGQRSNGSACWQHPSWVRVAGQVFVFGEASPEIQRLEVRRAQRPEVLVNTHLISRWPRARFWVAPMPTDTCSVNVLPADHAAASDPHTLGMVGPLADQTADQSRCTGTPKPPLSGVPTTARNGSGPPTTTASSMPVTPAPSPLAATTR